MASASDLISAVEDVVDVIEASEDFASVVESLNVDLGKLDDTVGVLNGWFDNMDQSTYRKRLPWPPGMERAYKRYKGLVEDFGTAHSSFETHRSSTRKNATPDQHAERAELALAWAKAAIAAAEARVDFMWMYRDAYKLSGIASHIMEIQNTINSGRNAVHEAKFNFKAVEKKLEIQKRRALAAGT